MKIYTKTGDSGMTGLLGGDRVLKNDVRVEAYGTVDELNASLGVAGTRTANPAILRVLPPIQRKLFSVGAILADTRPAAGRAKASAAPVTEYDVQALESEIDRCEAGLPALQQFILPGGSSGGAALHLARAVCRRAERRVVELSAGQRVDPMVVKYLNRLSDLLFVWARYENRTTGAEEVLWEGARKTSAPAPKPAKKPSRSRPARRPKPARRGKQR